MGKLATQTAAVLQVGATLVAFLGDQLFTMMGLMGTPFANYVSENKVQLLGFTFLFNSIAQSLAKTDAFEIFLNGELIFSRLQTKRMPSLDELIHSLSERGVGGVQQQSKINRPNLSSSQRM